MGGENDPDKYVENRIHQEDWEIVRERFFAQTLQN